MSAFLDFGFYKVLDSSGTQLELTGICNFPDEHEGECYTITVYGSEITPGMFESKLSDYHVYDDGKPKYRKVRGVQRPVYEPPKNWEYTTAA